MSIRLLRSKSLRRSLFFEMGFITGCTRATSCFILVLDFIEVWCWRILVVSGRKFPTYRALIHEHVSRDFNGPWKETFRTLIWVGRSCSWWQNGGGSSCYYWRTSTRRFLIRKTCTANNYKLGEERFKNLNKHIRDHGLGEKFLNFMVLHVEHVVPRTFMRVNIPTKLQEHCIRNISKTSMKMFQEWQQEGSSP